jgi:hypothetical protein
VQRLASGRFQGPGVTERCTAGSVEISKRKEVRFANVVFSSGDPGRLAQTRAVPLRDDEALASGKATLISRVASKPPIWLILMSNSTPSGCCCV